MAIADNSPVNWKLIKENPKKFWQTFAWVAPTFTVLFFLVAGRVWEVLPKIMGDELIYSRNARLTELADITVPNYLFALLFESTNSCGYGFYYCAKGLNLVFLGILVAFVYLAARLVARPAASLWIAVLAMVGPISTYTSYFTPEMMFFAGAAALLYSLFRLSSRSSWWAWVLIGVGLGLLALVKPHALFLAPPFVVYASFLALKGDGRRALRMVVTSSALIAALFVTKLGLGFLIAGQAGLGLFGTTYDLSAGEILQNGLKSSTAPDAPSANAIYNTGVFGAMGWQFAFHVGFLLIFLGLPLVLNSIEATAAVRSRKEPNQLQKISLLLVVSLATLVPVTGIFVATSESFGEMLQARVMVRYYEYLLPFLPLVLIAVRDKIEHVGKGTRWVIAGGFAIWLIIALPNMTTNVPALFTDSSLIASSVKSGIPLWVYAIVSLIPALYWIKDHEKGEKVWVYAFAPLMVLVFAISTHLNFTVTSSVIGNYTQASRWAHENLTDDQKDHLHIVGNALPNVQQAQFWVDNVNVTGEEIPENGELNLDNVADGKDYVLAIGSLSLTGEGSIIHQEGRFALIKVGK